MKKPSRVTTKTMNEVEQLTTDIRPQTHGDALRQFNVAQDLKEVMHNSLNWPHLNRVQREALEMTATKISRILNGDPNFDDHWLDAEGYLAIGRRYPTLKDTDL